MVVCQIPGDTSSTWYEPSEFRLRRSVAELVAALTPVSAWFDRQSGGMFVPEFVAAGEVTIGPAEGPPECVDKAVGVLAGAGIDSPGDRLLLVIADAEHRGEQPGGWGRPGVAYVGAADFHPDWGDRPPLDLVEHELGHALGWPHSGVGGLLDSALDVMSDSAAARSIDPTRRDAPSALAAHRAEAGWIDTGSIAELDDSGGELVVSTGNRSSGGPERSAVLVSVPGAAADTTLFIEAKADAGDDDHLDRSGIVIHRLEASGDLTPLVGEAPFLRPLAGGDAWSGDGWTIEVDELAPIDGIERWLVSCRPGERPRSD